ncbi:origin recognition complex subunit 4 isoform X1 [Procambarus clarkii]|uniref:origin recognition complex subunit 4 isoform X1 n=1 Tax=Procambarus clarkii TaxID=6728 RepID=UPI001E671CF8|nr:origin recognition complex subunit 4-like isoform X1 [Procambarus clarkii]XP_045605146.1 origin recognition complex subunit 4-like isoform X1 [Procambarus clarkii]XP_045605147.1 origin recognition complex subunit 4-like isoform X1 [Procambarus clarkii]
MGLKRQRSPVRSDLDTMMAVQKQLRLNLRLWGTTKNAGERIASLYSVERQHLEELMTRTLSLGESNSALVLAARGTGKSSLVKTVLERLEVLGTLSKGMVVNLSGLLQTDDRLALKEITRQLKLENATADKVFGSFAENLAFLLESLRSGSKETSKPVVFILDEFDLFCHHRNQTLLYNLFDVAQSAQAPICVLGLTCRLDVIELLEKRVKSRFSHRQIHLFPADKFDPHYLDTFKQLLELPDSFLFKDFSRKWNSDVTLLVEDQDIIKVLKRLHSTTKDIRALKTLLLLCVCQLSCEQPQLNGQMFLQAQSLVASEAKINMLHGLSVLQLCLIVAMKHLTTIYEGEPFNFEMVFHEYLKFSQRRSSMQSFERPVVFKAFDQLKCLELVRLVDNSRGIQREYQLVQLMMTPTQVTEALAHLPGIPTDVQQWAGSSLA